MSPAKTLGLLVLLVLLAGVWFLLREPVYTDPTSLPPTLEKLKSLEPSRVERVRLEHGDDQVVIERRGDAGWVVTSLWDSPADEAAVKRMLDALGEIESPQVRAESATSHANFELGPGQGTRVTLEGSGVSFPVQVTVGKSASMTSCFVRTPDGDEVYAVQPNLAFQAGLGGELRAARWADLTIFEQPDDLTPRAITLTTSEGTIRLEAKATEVEDEGAVPPPVEWRVVEPEEFDADGVAARGIANRIKNFRASELADPAQAEAYGLEHPERKVEFRFSDDSTVEVVFGQELPAEEGAAPAAGKRYYARRSDDARVFVVAAWARDGFFKTLDELRPPPPPEEAPTEDAPEPAADSTPPDGGK